MKVHWKTVTAGMDKLDKKWLSKMPEPADPKALAKVEKWFGHKLPADFKNFYLTHDGSGEVYILEPFLALADIKAAWDTWGSIADDPDENKELSEFCTSRPEGAVKPLYANRGWLPFFGDSQNFIALDYDPGPKGKVGQVINAGRDDDVRHVVADSFEGFIAFLGEQFKLGRVTKKHGSGRIVLDGEDRDFIQTLSNSLGLEADE